MLPAVPPKVCNLCMLAVLCIHASQHLLTSFTVRRVLSSAKTQGQCTAVVAAAVVAAATAAAARKDAASAQVLALKACFTYG